MTTKLTAEQKGRLLRRARQGASSRELAAEFDISQSTAAKLVRENTPPDPKALAVAKLQAIVDDESLPAGIRLYAAEALKTSLELQPEQPVKPRPLHVPSPHASSLDGVENLFGDDDEPKPASPPKDALTPAEQRAKDIERANTMMKQAVETGNVAAIIRLTEVFRKQGLYAEPVVPVSQKPALPMPPPDAAWVGRRWLLLECALLRGDVNTASELRAELDRCGADYPGKPKPEPAPERERPVAELPHIDEAGMARQAQRVRPVSQRVMEWDTYRDTF